VTGARRVLAMVAYAALVPIGVAVRLIGDPLGVRRPPRASNWRPVPDRPDSLDRARRLE
jgi:hypothetical protein